ncbi:ABC transporter ATP-binding protein [Methylomonas sp. MgM2]
MHSIIRFDRVSVSSREKTILSEISFTLYRGQKAMLSGNSGAGKSSVLRTLLGMHTIESGMVYFEEQALSAKTVRAIRACTAYIGQEPVLGADNVRDALLLPFQFNAHRKRRPSEAEISEVLQRLKLPVELLNQETRHISGGEKQRVALARGLLLGKTLFLLDEVTSALDHESKRAVLEVFAEPQFTVLAVSHDTDWLRRCDAVFNIEAGRIKVATKDGNAGY